MVSFCSLGVRGQEGYLLAVHDGLEGGSDGHLCFAVAHVPAQQPVHVDGLFHVLGDVADGALLVRRQLVGEGVLHLPLPGGVRAEGVAGDGFAVGVQAHQVEGQLFEPRLDLLFLPGPFAAAQGTQRRQVLGGADVFLHPLELVDGHVELVPAQVGDQQIIPGRALGLHPGDAAENADAVVLVDHVIPFVEVGKGFQLFTGPHVPPGLSVAGAEDVAVGDDAELFPGQDHAAVHGNRQNHGPGL